jgi:outer membrane protein assembly factor BamB
MFDPRKRSRPITLLSCPFVACLLLCGMASAEPSIILSKEAGPPTSQILVSGRGFEPDVGIDIYFDTKDEALVVTNGKGEFDNAKAFALRSARPGQHWVTALERNNDKGDQEPFLVQTDWSEFHFDADGTRLNPYENVLNTKSVVGLELNWSYQASAENSSPTVANGVVYVGSSDYNIYALSEKTGAKLWSYTTGGITSYSSPSVANGIVYAGSDDGHLYALMAESGALAWRRRVGLGVDSSPTVANGMVYVCSDGLQALKATTGARVWSYPLSCATSSPVVANGIVYVGSPDSNVYALNALTGANLWSYKTAGSLNSSPAVANGTLYIGSEDRSVYALDASSGTKLWSYSTGYYVFSSPAVDSGVVYIGSADGFLYALNGQTGALQWKFTNGEGQVLCSPAIANGVVYAATFHFYAVNAKTGTLLWSYRDDGNANVLSSPTVVNGRVYVGAGLGQVYAFGLTNADEVTQKEIYKRPALRTLRPDFNLTIPNGLQHLVVARSSQTVHVRTNTLP